MISLPEIASQMFESLITDDSASCTLFFVGGKSVGKSTLINLFLDKGDQVRDTLILEYSFGRKSNQKSRIDKDVCHVWEYGGSLNMLNAVLSSVPPKGNFTYCIMVDLSKIRLIWNTLEMAIKASKDLMKKTHNAEGIIIGAKYDLYKNYDSEVKKLICTTLRSVALINNFSVLFYTSKDPATVKRAREVLHGVGFGNGFPVKDKITTVTKPLFVPKGTDTWDNIGLVKPSFEEVKARYLSVIPLEAESYLVWTISGPPAAHAEPIIDAAVESNLEELRSLAAFDVSLADYFHKK